MSRRLTTGPRVLGKGTTVLPSCWWAPCKLGREWPKCRWARDTLPRPLTNAHSLNIVLTPSTGFSRFADLHCPSNKIHPIGTCKVFASLVLSYPSDPSLPPFLLPPQLPLGPHTSHAHSHQACTPDGPSSQSVLPSHPPSQSLLNCRPSEKSSPLSHYPSHSRLFLVALNPHPKLNPIIFTCLVNCWMSLYPTQR